MFCGSHLSISFMNVLARLGNRMCLIGCVQHAVVYAGGLHDLFLSHLNIRILCFELLLIVLFVLYVSIILFRQCGC